MTLTDGTELAPALGIAAFAEKTLVAAGQRASSNVGCTSSSTSSHSEVMCTSTAEIGQRLAELRARSPSPIPARLGTDLGTKRGAIAAMA